MTEDKLLTALMLLEMGMDELNPEYGPAADYMQYAHAYIQSARDSSPVPAIAQQIVARIRADAVIETAKHG